MPKVVLHNTLLVTIGFVLAACKPTAPLGSPATPTPLPSSEPTLPPAAPTIAASPTSPGYVSYQSHQLGIQFRYPATWHLQEMAGSTTLTSFDPAHPPHKLEWTDKTVSIQMGYRELARPFDSFDAWVESTAQELIAQHLEIASEERFHIAGQPAARLTLFSGSGGIIDMVLTVLDDRYFVIDIQGNYAAAADVLATIKVLGKTGAGTTN